MKFIDKAVFILLFLLPMLTNAQRLDIKPSHIDFENIFSRLENAYFINIGEQMLRIDSVIYKNNLYYIRFDTPYNFPFYIEPDDTVRMDCILAGYYMIPSSDTLDTLFVYSNSTNGVEDLEVRIKYWDDDFDTGIINGYVSDTSSLPVPDANIHFFYEGNYIIHTVQTDQNGFYSIELPPGSYTIAAQKDSFYVTFFGEVYDPYNAEFVPVDSGTISSADIVMPREAATSYSVSGFIFDSLSGTPLRKGVVVVRNGTHTPTKIAGGSRITNGVYTTFINDSGFYRLNNIIEPDYYYIQSFSDYFAPSYYNITAASQIFWQNADSVYVDSGLNNLHIYMPRDSSLGGGNALGSVTINTRNGDDITDVIIYAQAAGNDTLSYNYAFTSEGGNFKIPFLPFGEYRLVAQKIGYLNGYSSVFTIDSINTTVGNLEITLVSTSVDDNPFIPDNHILLYNYPNPFNPSTKIGFVLPFSSDVELNVFNILGEQVTNLKSEHLSPGKYEIDFNASGFSSGTYFVILKTKEGIKAKKILLLK